MLTKQELLEKFKNEKYWKVEIFARENFKRRKCSKCGSFFWSAEARETCGDPPCDIYSFIGNPVGKKYKWIELRNRYLKWFNKHEHEIINRYPTIARWKPDTMFTGASIYCFQPWVLNGTVEPPANPLVIDQPSIRFVDLDNVGLGTGRHSTCFSMLAHHCFNYKNKKIYWNDKTVELCYNWFVNEVKIPKNEIVFKENWWQGGGNAGPCFEVLIRGNEVATLVFMEFDVLGDKYSQMNIKVVDTGYGLERMVWLTHGTPTIYDSVHNEIIDFLKKEAKVNKPDKEIFSEFCKMSSALNIENADIEQRRINIVKTISKNFGIGEKKIMEIIEPYHNIYQIADHTKTIMFILGDGVVPSNVQEGYLARLLIRRAVRAMKNLGLNLSVSDIIEKQIKIHKKIYPEFYREKNGILKMVDVEQEKYNETLKRGGEIVKNLILESERRGQDLLLDREKFIELYDSNGLLPGDVRRFVREEFGNIKPIRNDAFVKPEKGIISMADITDIDTKIAVKKESLTKKKVEEKIMHINLKNLPETEVLYYKPVYKFKAKILDIIDNKYVILNKTVFYPRGGGQEPDIGFLEVNGLKNKVFDVERVGNVIIHSVENPNFKKGQTVNCVIDEKRRKQLTQHHTATHIINAASRKILGNHVWQHSAFKDVDCARLDITHYERLSERQIDKIEKMANKIVKSNFKIEKRFLPRDIAEKKYGFRLYQGGVPIGKEIRVVSINDIDHEACGGIHCNYTGEVGKIIITSCEKIQDGVVRINFVAGYAAEKIIEHDKQMVKTISDILKTQKNKIISATKKLIDKREKLETMSKQNEKKGIELLINKLKDRFVKKDGVEILIEQLDGDIELLKEISRRLTKRNTIIILFGLQEGKIYVFGSCGIDIKDIHIGNIIRDICKELGGGGGGSQSLGQGVGLKRDKIKEVTGKKLL